MRVMNQNRNRYVRYTYANMVMGVLENETIQDIQRHLGGTPWSETPFDVWQEYLMLVKMKGETYGIRPTSRLQ